MWEGININYRPKNGEADASRQVDGMLSSGYHQVTIGLAVRYRHVIATTTDMLPYIAYIQAHSPGAVSLDDLGELHLRQFGDQGWEHLLQDLLLDLTLRGG